MLLGLIVVVALLYISTTTPFEHRGRSPETSAVGAVRTINTAVVTYQQYYGNGYPPSLRTLGPPPAGERASCDAAGLIDPALALGQKDGFVFEYCAGPAVEKGGKGCTAAGAKSYTVMAYPVEYGKTGKLSFFSDDSGKIRATKENRRATSTDPPLE